MYNGQLLDNESTSVLDGITNLLNQSGHYTDLSIITQGVGICCDYVVGQYWQYS